jgi:hypothetical protein
VSVEVDMCHDRTEPTREERIQKLLLDMVSELEKVGVPHETAMETVGGLLPPEKPSADSV